MNHLVNKLNKKTSLTAKLFLATALMAITSVSVAEDDNVAYVDSVLKWGAWELDIEPAAGGISAPTPRALNARGAKITLRTNSIAALAPASPLPTIPGSATPPMFAPPAATPVTTYSPPPSPNVTTTNTTIPTGNGSLF